MKILHYNLGLPPYRSGGLTKYSIDLMEAQTLNNEVFLLFPGKNTKNKNMKINEYKKFNNIKCYELINALPVPLLGGIKEIDEFIKPVLQKEIFYKFLDEVKPDIIHIHTLMGIPKEFLLCCKEKNIKTVFTTHDYFGICPKVNLLSHTGENCTDYKNGEVCIRCNENAYSLKLINLMQNPIYRILKETTIIKKLRNFKKGKISTKDKENSQIEKEYDLEFVKFQSEKYKTLRTYYLSMLALIDYIHYNSNNTKNIYEEYETFKGDVISIGHSNIIDKRKIKKYENNSLLKILYLGPMEKFKGINFLIDSLEIVFKKNKNWKLSIYGVDSEHDFGLLNKNIEIKGKYSQSELDNIIEENDIMIVPSLWNETFSLVLLEGYSRGIPIITTESVGAKDILRNKETGFILKHSKEELSNLILQILNDRNILIELNKAIVQDNTELDFKEHVDNIYNLYDLVRRK